MEKKTVYVLHYEYRDKTGYGIEAIYQDEEEAKAAYDLLDKYDSNRNWFIDPYEVK